MDRCLLVWLITSFLWDFCTIFSHSADIFAWTLLVIALMISFVLHFFSIYSWSNRVSMRNSSILICFTPFVQRFPPNTIQFRKIRKIIGSFSTQNHFLHEPELFYHICCFFAENSRYFALYGRIPLSSIFRILRILFWSWASYRIKFATEDTDNNSHRNCCMLKRSFF